MQQRYDIIHTPLGQIVIMENAQGITYIGFDEHAARSRGGVRAALRFEAEHQLKAYFNKTLIKFDLPLILQGTAFQKNLFTAVLDIPFGHARSYGQLAEALGNARAAHSVGQALARNPLCIVVPCHRILAAHGFLGSYGSQLWRKRFLLEWESIPFR